METDRFKITGGKGFNLADHDTAFTGEFSEAKAAEKAMRKNIKKLKKLQGVLYAHNRYALLIIFQAMDAAGKDGAIKHVMSGLNPQGTQVYSFKKPSQEEIDHDYLWRCSKALPERGRIGIFNRSYYEDVLVVRVHPEILHSRSLPDPLKNDADIWNHRFRQIRNYEQHLHENGTRVIKFFLHLSKDEQKRRFLARINTPEKNWKFSSADAVERGYWDDYMHAFQDAIRNTSTEFAPWYVLPADHKWFTRFAVSEIVARELGALDMEYPTMSAEHMENLKEAKRMLESE